MRELTLTLYAFDELDEEVREHLVLEYASKIQTTEWWRPYVEEFSRDLADKGVVVDSDYVEFDLRHGHAFIELRDFDIWEAGTKYLGLDQWVAATADHLCWSCRVDMGLGETVGRSESGVLFPRIMEVRRNDRDISDTVMLDLSKAYGKLHKRICEDLMGLLEEVYDRLTSAEVVSKVLRSWGECFTSTGDTVRLRS